ncbi:hypothetical protein [Lentibacillus sp. CBA3610]|uniref:hypothetical protein n=1 Tax=Lentibacillus sp. CBA3610 TaxID=2518176 RepID=UPI0015955CE4|nr:hypothetical protein [Lentibacillus sp. CBA3610]QKY68571.1 hypothetical protein Len3610_02115 [Lentibacillus sp. CBA3610]
MKTTASQKSKKLLRTIYPDAYGYLMDKLKENNIHSFDVQITGKKVGSSVEVNVRFGETFSQELTRTFSEDVLHNPDDSFEDFSEEIKNKCQERLIADYFKMLRP